MTLTLPALLALAALASAVVIIVETNDRVLPAIAVTVAGLEVAIAFGILHFSIRGLPVGLLLAGALAIAAVLLYRKVQQRIAITAATVMALVGAIQLLTVLHVV